MWHGDVHEINNATRILRSRFNVTSVIFVLLDAPALMMSKLASRFHFHLLWNCGMDVYKIRTQP